MQTNCFGRRPLYRKIHQIPHHLPVGDLRNFVLKVSFRIVPYPNATMLAQVPLGNERSVHIMQMSNRDLGSNFADVVRIEEASFPPSIRDSASDLVKLAESPLALFLVGSMKPTNKVVGYLAAERLELFNDVPGIQEDPHFGLGDSVYLASVAVLEPYRHRKIGITMEKACLALAHKKGFLRVAAHVRKGALQRMQLPGRVIKSFLDWYQTGEAYDYIEIPLNGL